LKDLAVNGNDVTALGFSGRTVGDILRRLLEQVVDGELPNDRALLLEAAANNSADFPDGK
jgi:tRNA nucleotidyltransferase (CCA-adding enzyme)